jgi:CheY-like chemotaxis protein
MNLLVNARDAVTDSARPAPRISVTVAASPDSTGSESRGVSVTITDDGIGMTEDVALRAFDPFFTTKPVGRGTGLGLTTSYAIVRELRGTMSCTSSPGAGTTFTFWLPGTPVAPLAASDSRPPATSRGHVLVVDDDASVRQALSALLVSEGFAVVAVATGEAGVAHLVTRAPLDVIVLDRSMPGAPGETFVPRLRALAPNVPILMFTGQAVDVGIAGLVDQVLLKPVSATALVEALDALVATAPAAH